MSITLIYETPCKEKSYLYTLTYETVCKDYMTQRVRIFETNEAFRLRCEEAWSKLLKYCTDGVFKFKQIDPDEDFDYMVEEFIEDVCKTVEDRDYESLPPLEQCVGCQHSSFGQRAHMERGGCLHDMDACLAHLERGGCLHDIDACIVEDCAKCNRTYQCDKCGDMFELADGETFEGLCLSCEMQRVSLGQPKLCECGQASMSYPWSQCEECYYDDRRYRDD
jgi:hypothetical protein